MRGRGHRHEASSEPIDFVVSWVNSDDPEWRARRNEARRRFGLTADEGGASDVRHRDWGLFRFWFRAVDQFCPWVRKIHVVHAGSPPDWLDTDHHRLQLVPDGSLLDHGLDVFNSHAIESRIHTIPGLSERFVYFNDDFYIGRSLSPEFFFPEGLPYGVNVPTILADGDDRAHAMLNASGLINKHFTRNEYWRTVAKKTLRPASGAMLLRAPLFLASSVIPPVTDPHVGMPFLKSLVAEAFAAEPAALEAASRATFRSAVDVAPMYFASMWHLARGAYTARSKRSLGSYFSLADDVGLITTAISSGRVAQLCINDAPVADVNERGQALAEAFRARFPLRSSFEAA